MDAIKLLKMQHDEVEELLEELEASGPGDARADQFARIADALAGHSEVEERLFYPALREAGSEDLVAEALEEHLSVKRLLADLLDMRPSDDRFIAKVKVLREQVEHHVGEEESEMFRAAKKALGTEELDRLGAQMEQMYTELLRRHPRFEVPRQVAQAQPHR